MRTIAELTKALSERIERRRQIQRLQETEHLSLRQIGERLGISHEAVRQILDADPGWSDEDDR
ncbi:MAG TPA: sigma factor-like helix-turn-helix DNA-binding protein [Anaerolineales bacterium]|nr:sigma factor-like helix-turn-helix DNA-binding protein [Anaerolineales bacterium]